MKTIKHKKTSILLALLTTMTVVGLMLSNLAQAAIARPSPTTLTKNVGQTFQVSIVIDGQGELVKGFSGTVATTNLTITSVAMKVGGPNYTCLTVPTTSSTHSFGCSRFASGGVSSVTVYTMTVKGKTAGNATVSLSGVRIKDTSNALIGSSGSTATFKIVKPVATPPAPKPTPKPAPTPTPTSTPTSTRGSVSASVTPSTTQSSQTASPATTDSESPATVEGEVLGEEVAQADEVTVSTDQAETDTRAYKILGLAWYWWLLILISLGLAYSYFASGRSKNIK